MKFSAPCNTQFPQFSYPKCQMGGQVEITYNTNDIPTKNHKDVSNKYKPGIATIWKE
jgi:hypothetical protein